MFRVKDHVYVAAYQLGVPYQIGRVMEFHRSSEPGELQIRLAWYNRPGEAMARPSSDHRFLVATMQSDWNPVSDIRGKCYVLHKHYIPAGNLDDYKKQDDKFYFHQSYDKYSRSLYDVVPSELIRNVPEPVPSTLWDRYHFVVVEQGKSAELTAALRGCCVCGEWCSR